MTTSKDIERAKAGLFCCCCIIIIVLIIAAISLAFQYWYISLPIIATVVIFAYVYKQKQTKRLVELIDTIPNQQEFQSITGYNAIENGMFTDKYKAWLLQKSEISTFKLFTNPQIRPSHTLPQQPYQQQTVQETSPSTTQASTPLNLEEQKIFCPLCGAKNKVNSKYCISCGGSIK